MEPLSRATLKTPSSKFGKLQVENPLQPEIQSVSFSEKATTWPNLASDERTLQVHSPSKPVVERCTINLRTCGPRQHCIGNLARMHTTLASTTDPRRNP